MLLGSIGVTSAAEGDPAPAQPTSPVPPTPPPGASEVTVEAVQAKLKKLDEVPDLDPAIKTKLTESYSKTLEQLRTVPDFVARGEQFGKLSREAPETLKRLRAELAVPAPEIKIELPEKPTLAQVQQQLSQAEMALSDAQKALQTLLDEPKRRADRRIEIPKRIDAIKLLLADIDKQLDLKPAPEESPEVTAAARMLLEARKRSLNAEQETSQLELQFFEATGELLSAQRDLAARQAAAAESLAKELRTRVNDRRRIEAEEQARQAQMASAQAHPAVKKIAEANAELANLRQMLASKIEKVSRDLDSVNNQLTSLNKEFTKIKNRIDTVGGTQAMGLLLRKQRDELPSLSSFAAMGRQGAAEISNTYLELIEYEENRNDLATLDTQVQEAIATVTDPVPLDELGFLDNEIRTALGVQQTVYDSLISDTNSYLDSLVELDVRQRLLIETAGEVADYCDERILWIRSTTSLGTVQVRQLGASAQWLTNPSSWLGVCSGLWKDALANSGLTMAMGLLCVVLIGAQRPLRARLALLGETASRSNLTSFVPTLRAFITTGLIAVIWPLLLAYIGWRLRANETPTEFEYAIARGLLTSSAILGTLEFFRSVSRRMGLGQAHFGWDNDSLRLVRRTQWQFLVLALPLIFVVAVTESQPSETIKSSLGRVAFLGSLVVLIVCTHRLTRPDGGALEPIYREFPQGWLTRLRHIWHWMSLGIPLILGLMSISGYHYTATQLAWRLLITTWLMSGILIVHAALIRWSLLSYRELAMRKARERREAEATAAAVEGASPPPAAVVAKAQQVTALAHINKQNRKALQLASLVALLAGLWLIWADVLPALGALRHIPVWDIETKVITAAGEETIKQPVSLASLLLSILIATMTVAASRNLPSLLEIALLQKLPLDPGVRYAITTVCKYVITTTGLIVAFGTVGIGWSKVQWLVAAISVGLGFGLQEIFANFVSGLILLFERPVRLGDIVTVGDATGNVTQIQMRATTITDWDMREIVIPNRELITGRVMNWTLSNKVSRMSVHIGVAYGTNPDQVRTLLMAAATRNPLVLNDPPPHALFDEFGDSTLNFVLRVYMNTRDVYLQLRHSLLSDIAKDFELAGIEFAFPQTDIHIRTVPSEVSWSMNSASTGLDDARSHPPQSLGSAKSE